jgi:hypothetical protein
MENQPKKSDRDRIAALSAMELFGSGPSEAHKQGRRLVMKFRSREMPELDRIEFHASKSPKYEYLQSGNDSDSTRSIRAAAVAKALPLFFLDYLCARFRTPPKPYLLEGGDGSLAATIGYALTDSNGAWRSLFTEFLPTSGTVNRVNAIFAGANLHGKNEGQRIISVRADYLPSDCIEIVWHNLPLTGRDEIQNLTDHFRKAWNLPPPTPLTLPEGEQKETGGTAEVGETTPAPAKVAPQKDPAYFVEASDIKTVLLGLIPPKKPAPPKSPKDKFTEDEKTEKPPTLNLAPNVAEMSDEFSSQVEPEFPKNETPAPRKIDPALFEIQNPNRYTWEDSEPLLNFGNDASDGDVWRIRDACEGVAVFGAVGSGKTSGSGSAIARAFLQAGFGGLVLTVKPDEAHRWRRMCDETGRAGDFIHVTPASGHHLNFLQYEIQRPGERLAVTDDLIALFRTLIGVMSRSKRGESGDDFWTNTTNQLIRKLTDIFLLAGEPLTLDRMVRFINQAPKDINQEWRYSDLFADVLQRAEEFAQTGSAVDQRIHRESFEYWTEAYPAVAEETRSGFITMFASMADVLSGRGIHEMIGTDTNLTPEMILSGKVVVLDIPLKGNIQGGIMVQSMWKLLFQQAVERRTDKGLPTARPAFLWEDEGHMFFSQHDVDFQPTARDIRAPHVILSQNLHNFFQQGHNEHAVEAVFAAMNTYLFHTNGDLLTNRWASDHIGEIKHLKLTTDGLLKPLRDKDISFWERRPEEVENVGKIKITEEQKRGLPPEDFAKLKRGGDGTCEAVLLWLSHQFTTNHHRNFCVVTFAQEERPETKEH